MPVNLWNGTESYIQPDIYSSVIVEQYSVQVIITWLPFNVEWVDFFMPKAIRKTTNARDLEVTLIEGLYTSDYTVTYHKVLMNPNKRSEP